MKRKVRIIIGLLLIIVGLVLFAIPKLSSALIKNEQDKAVARFNEIDREQLVQNAQREDVEFDFSAISSINVETALTNTLFGSQDIIDTYKQDIVGRLIIEDLDIDLVIFNGINDQKLYVGVTTLKPGQVIGQGNYSIAGHWSYNDGLLLSRLPDIQIGTIIKLIDQETVYEYKVYNAELVLATDVHLIEDYIATEHGSPIVSVMSCWETNHDTHRWFAFGELINSYPNTGN